jgi:hypothetical protein
VQNEFTDRCASADIDIRFQFGVNGRDFGGSAVSEMIPLGAAKKGRAVGKKAALYQDLVVTRYAP